MFLEAGGGVAHRLSLPRIVCQRMFIFLLGWRMCGHTIFVSGDLCATDFSFFSVD